MNTKKSMLKLANLGSVGLFFTIQSSNVSAVTTTAAAHTEAQINAEISALANSVQQALASTGQGSEAVADNTMKAELEAQMQSFLAESIMNEETQKTNLEERNLVGIKQKVSAVPEVTPPF
jgi:hypothetical protein